MELTIVRSKRADGRFKSVNPEIKLQGEQNIPADRVDLLQFLGQNVNWSTEYVEVTISNACRYSLVDIGKVETMMGIFQPESTARLAPGRKLVLISDAMVHKVEVTCQ